MRYTITIKDYLDTSGTVHIRDTSGQVIICNSLNEAAKELFFELQGLCGEEVTVTYEEGE